MQTGRRLSYIKRTAHSLRKQREIPRCNFLLKITWRLRIETIATKALRIFISIYPLLKSERLSVNTILTLESID